MNADFTAASAGDVADLLAETPLCWIVPHADPTAAILMPVMLEEGHTLLGHLPLRAPITAVLRGAPRASFLFLGPHGYVAPAHAGLDDWAPTWNFASARIEADVTIDAALTAAAVEGMVATREGEWSVQHLGERYAALSARIIGFRATIVATRPRFKLAQDETPTVRDRIMAAHEGTPLGAWMRRFAERG